MTQEPVKVRIRATAARDGRVSVMSDESHKLRGQTPVAEEDRSPTIRTTPVAAVQHALPDHAADYVAPQPMPRTSEHKTIDMVPVRLSPEINPRNAQTQRLSTLTIGRRGTSLVLGGVVAALALAALSLGAPRLRGRVPPSGIVPAASTKVPAPMPLPNELRLPEASVIEERAPVALGPQPAAPGSGTGPRARSRVEPSAAPASKPPSKGRNVWLE